MQLSRRDLITTFAVAAYAGSGLDSRQRIERALAGKDVDRPPFSAWHHFHLESQGPEVFAKATVDFHRQTGTDLVKVMSDFQYPKSAGGITQLRPEANPFPAQFSEPFDKRILAAARNAPLNVLHLHGEQIYWKRFTKGWATAAINYSSVATHVPISAVRTEFPGLILSGIDEDHFPALTTAQLREQAQAARAEAGRAFVLSPGCSVPDKTNTESISRLGKVFA